jgi:Bacterial pre-peptidase C-terminal domain
MTAIAISWTLITSHDCMHYSTGATLRTLIRECFQRRDGVLERRARLEALGGGENVAAATVLTGTTASATGGTIGATKEAGEPSHAGNVGGKSIWYSWTAPASGTVTVNTSGSNFDTLLAVYTGSSVSGLSAIAANDDAVPGSVLTSSVTFAAVQGTVYHIAVDGYNAASGAVALNLSEVLPAAAPANDNFANAVTLSGNTVTWPGTNIGATREIGEPNPAGVTGGASVWLTWTPTTTHTVTINTHGSNFDTVLAVYTGSSVMGLTTVAANDDDVANRTLTSAVTFTAVAGTVYHIAVDGYHGATGSIVLNLA